MIKHGIQSTAGSQSGCTTAMGCLVWKYENCEQQTRSSLTLLCHIVVRTSVCEKLRQTREKTPLVSSRDAESREMREAATEREVSREA